MEITDKEIIAQYQQRVMELTHENILLRANLVKVNNEKEEKEND